MAKKIALGIVLFLVALQLFIMYGRANLIVSKEQVKAKYSLPNSHFINWKGAEIHYTESGKGFPILMIHGFGGSNYDFLPLDSLINNQYRVIRVDLPGFGLSDFPEIEGDNLDYLQAYEDYFTFLLDTLHIDSCYVMGNSLGGMMAWNLTVRKPDEVKKLVLFNSAGYDMMDVMKSANAYWLRFGIVQQTLKKGLPKFMVKIGAARVVYDATKLTDDKVQRVSDLWNRDGNLTHLINLACSDKFPDQNDIKKIHCPTLIFWGKQDKIVHVKYAERFHKDIEGSRLIIYDSCGHVPMLERTFDVERDVLPFLNDTTL